MPGMTFVQRSAIWMLQNLPSGFSGTLRINGSSLRST
jgi:hypothetical protein